MIDFAPFAPEAIQKLKESDPILGNPAAIQRLWKKFREAYLEHKAEASADYMEPFSTQLITKHMTNEVTNQNRPRPTLESIAGIIRHLTTQINIFSQKRQDDLQYFIESYVARHTLTPMARKGIADIAACIDVILSETNSNQWGGRLPLRYLY